MEKIAIVGLACRYPDAASPRELWENALAGRRAFRRIPDERLPLDDYYDPDPATPDTFYARNAAVIEGYEFDRIAYKVAGSTYRSTDLTHWLALDVAALALADAGFPMAEGLPRERTAVVVGNTLTGEFSRANQLRLRWPYVRRTLAAALKEQQWPDDQLATFLDEFESSFKHPFPGIDEDTLAGGLSNTIAGRICNHFDLKGGGYTVDGACSSSLLSVATAGKALVDGDADVAVAGGVDLSIDPFEMIGFAKTGALATSEMRVYDRNSNGFWPGEGCGMVVLMRESDARAAGHRVYASIAGWGVSSDGKGGMTRPEARGYQLALRRAYERAGFGIDSVALFEGHGTGTKVGDATELAALSEARRAADEHAAPAAIGSIKGMIGHTKAAAGVAGLIKATLAVHHQVLPPTVGCVDPHEVLAEEPAALRVLRTAEAWPDHAAVRAGVTAMGFGGINTHIVLDSATPKRRRGLDTRTRALATSAQDAELLLADARSPQELRERLEELIGSVTKLAYGQLADLAATLHRELRDLPYRAAAVVSSPEDAVQRLRTLCDAIDAGEPTVVSGDGRAFLGHASGPGRLGFLLPGQGSGTGTSGGALRRRFADVDDVYRRAALPTSGDMVATEVAQPRIVTGSIAGFRVLATLGLEATVAVGHSLGEISALHWAGALDEDALLRLAQVRGKAMGAHSASGTMAGFAAPPERVEALIDGLPVNIAGYNGPQQTVIAGTVEAVQRACDKATDAGVRATRLSVSHAFHSPLVAPSAEAFGAALAGESFGPVERRVVSTVTGEPLSAGADLADLLRRQITSPVRFTQAVTAAAETGVDLFVEVGPGRVLSGLATEATGVPAVALDTDDESLVALLRVIGAAYVVGGSRVDGALFHGRLLRPLPAGQAQSFFASPCEAAPPLPAETRAAVAEAHESTAEPEVQPPTDADVEPFELLRRLAAERAELPLDFVHADSHLLDELHLSSITVGQVMNQAAQELGIATTQAPTNFATATVGELAEALEELLSTAYDDDRGPGTPSTVAGAATWVRPWSIDLDEQPVPAPTGTEKPGTWHVYADDDPFAESLRSALEAAPIGGGVLVVLGEECPEDKLEMALYGARRAMSGPDGTRFVLVQPGRGAAGLAKTLRLEAPNVRTTIVHTPLIPDAVDRVVAEVAGSTRYTESHLDHDGGRRVPTLRPLPARPARTTAPLDDTDVLLVTGGGKGITAECALAMATDSGARLALIGRSDPAEDRELAENLRRMTDAGVTVRYARADVSDADEVQRAVAELTGELGPVTAVLHGAGRNEPAGLTSLAPEAFRQVFAPKIDGLRAVLAAVDPAGLKLLVTLGSIIGRAGLRGEAHYATANEWLADLTVATNDRYPNCRALCIEWSVWSGVGMGERLSVVESLARDGVTPVTPGEGVAILRRLLADPDAPSVVLVSGRTQGIETLRYDEPELPLLRFLERPLVRYHGVELVTEVDLSAGSDLYLGDHELDGNLLFPAVFGMEAMAQVAAAVTGRAPDGPPPVIEQAEFLRPIVVPPDGSTTVRVAAVVTDDDAADTAVDVVIHSAETGSAAEDFRATLRYQADATGPEGPAGPVDSGVPPVPIEPAKELYGDTLFQGERFQRLRRYHRAGARDVDADVAVEPARWFAGYLTGDLVLGDPGVRDALMHGNQVCVPDATLLPAGVERIYPCGPLAPVDELRYCATERSHEGDTYIYDIALRTPSGETIERWEGLRLQAVRKKDAAGPWVAPLVGPYLERTLDDLIGASVSVAVEPAPAEPDGDGYVAHRREHTAVVASHTLGEPATVHYRPDGRPELDGDRVISAAHGDGLTLCVTASGPVGCDLEPVTARSADEWQGLLGPHAELAEQTAEATGESPDTAATRVWSAIECLQKVDASPNGPVTLLPPQRDGWTVFGAGEHQIAVLATTVRDHPDPIVFAVLSERQR